MSLQVDDVSSLPHSDTAIEQAIRGEDWMGDRFFRANQGQSLTKVFDESSHSFISQDLMGDNARSSAQSIVVETWYALPLLYSFISRSIANLFLH